ncbi:MAG: hypothetical protein V1858_02605 [Candidatus Gottesmanbacteria bacterium]
MSQEIIGIKATGNKVKAELIFLGKEELPILALTKEVSGKIIAVGKLGRAALMKVKALSIVGLVVTDIESELFEALEHGTNWEIGESLCIKLPLLVVDKTSFNTIKDFNGKEVTLDPQEEKLTLTDK